MRRTKHVLRDDLPWTGPFEHGQCGRRISRPTQTITRGELEELLAGAGLSGWSSLYGDKFLDLCRSTPLCQNCVRATVNTKSWQQSPLECLSRHAEFASGHTNRHVESRALAELAAITEIVNADREHFEQLVLRHQALWALGSTNSWAPR